MYAHWSRCNKEPLIAAVHSHDYLELCWKLPGCCSFLLVFPQFVSLLFFFLCPSSNSQKGPDIAEAFKYAFTPDMKFLSDAFHQHFKYASGFNCFKLGI